MELALQQADTITKNRLTNCRPYWINGSLFICVVGAGHDQSSEWWSGPGLETGNYMGSRKSGQGR